jgi:hypothetical protein
VRRELQPWISSHRRPVGAGLRPDRRDASASSVGRWIVVGEGRDRLNR